MRLYSSPVVYSLSSNINLISQNLTTFSCVILNNKDQVAAVHKCIKVIKSGVSLNTSPIQWVVSEIPRKLVT